MFYARYFCTEGRRDERGPMFGMRHVLNAIFREESTAWLRDACRVLVDSTRPDASRRSITVIRFW